MIQPIRVLLVEDNPADAELTKETLESGKVHVDITIVTNGEEALSYLLDRVGSSAALPDLILLDLNLPRMDGRELLEEVKKHAALRLIPVVVLTSSDAEQDILKSYSLGAACFVTKPVGLEAFRNIVGSVQEFWFSVVKLP